MRFSLSLSSISAQIYPSQIAKTGISTSFPKRVSQSTAQIATMSPNLTITPTRSFSGATTFFWVLPLIASFSSSPSVSGFLLILLHVLTIAGAISRCSAASGGSNKWYALHMVGTVLTAIFQGFVSVLIFTTTDNFLGALKSYVREDDAAIILKMVGGLSIAIFCLEWVVLVLAFVLRYYGVVEGNNGERV